MARRALTIGTWFAAVAVAALLAVPAHAQTTQRDKAGKPGTIKRAQAAVAPAKAWGLYGTKGVIAVGAHADIAFVDMAKAGTLSQGRLQTISKISPWHGRAASPSAGLVRDGRRVQARVEDEDAARPRPAQELVRREHHGVQLLHRIGRVHVDVRVRR